MKHKLSKYLKESCSSSSDEQFSFKYFANIAFVRDINKKVRRLNIMQIVLSLENFINRFLRRLTVHYRHDLNYYVTTFLYPKNAIFPLLCMFCSLFCCLLTWA